MKIFLYRHQAAGVLWEYPFSAPPSEADLEALRGLMRARHGTHHPKTRTPYWDKVGELQCLGAGQLAKVIEQQLADAKAAATAASAMAAQVQASGTGTVEVK